MKIFYKKHEIISSNLNEVIKPDLNESSTFMINNLEIEKLYLEDILKSGLETDEIRNLIKNQDNNLKINYYQKKNSELLLLLFFVIFLLIILITI